MTACFSTKEKPSLQGWASLGRNGPEGTSSPKDQEHSYALPYVSVVMQVTRWSGYAPRKRAQPMTTALSFFLGVCPDPGTGGLGGLAGTRRRVNFCHPRSVPHSVDIISAASNRTSMKLATFLTALLLPCSARGPRRDNMCSR
jgi:hypothetical protein